MTTEHATHAEMIKECDDTREALARAGEYAAMTFGGLYAAVIYGQAGRTFLSTSLPMKVLVTRVTVDSTNKREDPTQHHNRILDKDHVADIVEYLTEKETTYILPAVTLNVDESVRAFTIRGNAGAKMGWVVIPQTATLYVTDGQHRLEAIKLAIGKRSSLAEDGIGATIVVERDLDKIHQDFYDCSRTHPLNQSLLIQYDFREPLNWITREVSTKVQLFNGRIEKAGNVGKNSLMLFTANQVKQGIEQLLVGDWSLFSDAIEERSRQMLTPETKERWLSLAVEFFEAFAESNPQWRAVRDNPLTSAIPAVDVPALRAGYLHFAGAGLLVLGGVAHGILAVDPSGEGHLTPSQRETVRDLANLDWSRTGALWKGYLVGPQGNVTPHKNHIFLAVAKLKTELGLPVSAKEQAHIDRAAATLDDEPGEPKLTLPAEAVVANSR